MKKTDLALKKIASILYVAEDEKDLKEILEDLLTPSEVADIIERILIVGALLEGKPQRKVAQDLHVSVSKVTRGSQLLQFGTGALAAALE